MTTRFGRDTSSRESPDAPGGGGPVACAAVDCLVWLRVGAALEFETAIDPLSVLWRARAHLSSSLFTFSPLSSPCPVSQYRGDKPSLGPPFLFAYTSFRLF